MTKVISLAGSSRDARRTRLRSLWPPWWPRSSSCHGSAPRLGRTAAGITATGATTSSCSSPPTAFVRTSWRATRTSAWSRVPRPAAQGHTGLGSRPADPGAAQHRRGLVHARNRRLAGRPRLDQQHLPHQRRPLRRRHRPAAARGVRPRRAAGRDARPGGRARRQEGRPDRVGRRPQRAIDGPTVDFRNFLSGRGVTTNYISPDDVAGVHCSFGLQFDHPVGFASQPPFPQAAPSPATGWTNVPTSYSPARETRMRVLDVGVDKYGLNAYIYDSRNDGRTSYDRVLFSPTKNGADAVGNLREGEWADVKVTLETTNALNGKTGAMLSRSSGCRRPVPGPPLPHLGHASDRHVADLGGRAGLHRHVRGLRGRAVPVLAGGRLRGPRGGHRLGGDLRRAGPVLGDRAPAADQVHPRHLPARPGDGRLPGDGRVPAPVHRARDAHAAERGGQPRLRRRSGQRHAGRPRAGSARHSSAAPTRAPTPPCAWPRRSCATAT